MIATEIREEVGERTKRLPLIQQIYIAYPIPTKCTSIPESSQYCVGGAYMLFSGSDDLVSSRFPSGTRLHRALLHDGYNCSYAKALNITKLNDKLHFDEAWEALGEILG